MNNAEVARALAEIGDLLELEDASIFRIRAYRFASQVIADLPRETSDMLAAGDDLTALPGIGKDLAAKIRELTFTGDCEALREVRARTKPSLVALMRVPGLGPKRVRALWDALRLESVEEVAAAARAQQIRGIKGFGAKTEERILEAIEARRDEPKRVRIDVADEVARELVDDLSDQPGVARVIAAGSLRRGKETIGDLDLLVTAAPGTPVMERFTRWYRVERILSNGTTRASIAIDSGLQIDLRLVAGESYGAALHYFTGSKEHNVAIRMLGVSSGLKINEYGVFHGDERIAGETEESVFASIGLPFIDPELRENRGEISAARAKRLPELITLEDLRGDLRVRSKYSGGPYTIPELARERFEYLAVVERVKSDAFPDGVSAADFARELLELERDPRLIPGLEVAIREDGSLDAPEEMLARAKIVVASIQSGFALDSGAQTERVLRALDHPRVTMFAHPSARIIGERDPLALDLARIAITAAKRGVWLELCADPARLDLSDHQARFVRTLGASIAIGSGGDPTHLKYGVAQARRAWLGRADLVNSRTREDLPLRSR